MESRTITITPSLAEDILTRNAAGRPISRERVRRYLEEMRAERWRLNPQGISFSGPDMRSFLVDGQHRLTAVIRYGKPVDFYVHFNVSQESQQTMDQGLTRTGAQLVASDPGIASAARPRTLAAAARILLEYGQGQKRPANTHVLNFVRTHEDVLDRYAGLAEAYQSGTVAAFAFADLVGLQGVEEAAHRLAELEWDADDDPMRALARALATLHGQGARAQKVAFFTSIRALESVHRGEPLAVVRKTDSPARKSVFPDAGIAA